MPDLQGKTVVVTGASGGIGAAAARRFAELGATVAVVGRSPEKTVAVAAESGGDPCVADFGRLDDVRALARELLRRYPRIDVLANNAGAVFAGRRTSADGHELTFQVNYLAPFLLTRLLLGRLAGTPEGRVVNTASTAYHWGTLDLDDLDHTRGRYRSQRSYGAAKLAMILFTRELARRTPETGVTAAAFHPGAVASGIVRDNRILGRLMDSRLARLVLATPERGAEPLLHLATAPDAESVNGHYFRRFEREEPRHRQAGDAELARRLWERSEALTGLAGREADG